MSNNVKEIVGFLGLKLLNSDNYYMFSCSRNAQVTFEDVKKCSFQNYKHFKKR